MTTAKELIERDNRNDGLFFMLPQEPPHDPHELAWITRDGVLVIHGPEHTTATEARQFAKWILERFPEDSE